jgi:uncharacterized protein YbbK (DUF523 family)/uncharacterized protein YbgA (DUF1722 family)
MSYSSIKPKIVVSTCLGFGATRFNGAMLQSSFINHVQQYDAIEFIPVCPEVGIGLGVPRETLRLVKKKDGIHLIQPETGKDVTAEMVDFTNNLVKDLVADGFIFKADSPSVGTDHVKVYDSEKAFVGSRSGIGFFTNQIIKHFENYPLESDRRLHNVYIQDAYLTKVYTFARYRQFITDLSSLKDFHRQHYYLLKTHEPHSFEKLDKLISEIDVIKEPFAKYFTILKQILRVGVTRQNALLSFQEIAQRVTTEISKNELTLLQKKMTLFEKNAIAKETMLSFIQALAHRIDDQFLKSQIIYEPFPPELLQRDDPLEKRFRVNAYDLE